MRVAANLAYFGMALQERAAAEKRLLLIIFRKTCFWIMIQKDLETMMLNILQSNLWN
jgi:hypothetical protein